MVFAKCTVSALCLHEHTALDVWWLHPQRHVILRQVDLTWWFLSQANRYEYDFCIHDYKWGIHFDNCLFFFSGKAKLDPRANFSRWLLPDLLHTDAGQETHQRFCHFVIVHTCSIFLHHIFVVESIRITIHQCMTWRFPPPTHTHKWGKSAPKQLQWILTLRKINIVKSYAC